MPVLVANSAVLRRLYPPIAALAATKGGREGSARTTALYVRRAIFVQSAPWSPPTAVLERTMHSPGRRAAMHASLALQENSALSPQPPRLSVLPTPFLPRPVQRCVSCARCFQRVLSPAQTALAMQGTFIKSLLSHQPSFLRSHE